MRRLGLIAIVSLCFVALVGTTVLARPASPFSVKASRAQVGGHLDLSVKAGKSVKNPKFTATAVVHFASGDVKVELTRKGKSYEARARVRVGAKEAPGEVAVDFTITYGGLSLVLSTKGVIEAPERDDDDDDDDDRDNNH